MRGVLFDAAIAKYLVTRALGTLDWRLMVGPGRSTRMADLDEPALPGPRWVKVRTRLGGICGSDLALVSLRVSPSASPFSSSPCVLGHENVGVIEEVGSGVRGFARGDRVVANPLLPCVVRGFDPPCARCAAGEEAHCENVVREGPDGVAPGMILGTTRGLGGSWGERFVAHESRLYRIPDEIEDRVAVLIEPFACSLEPVLAHPPTEGERAFVIGSGTIGLFAVAALKAAQPACRVTVLYRHDFQAKEAERLGADELVKAGRKREHLEAVERLSRGRLVRPIIGPSIHVGGFDRTIVCAGGSGAVEDSLRFTRSGGAVDVLGNLWQLPRLDWTPLWMKGIALRGSVCYGSHDFEGRRQHVFRVIIDLLREGRLPDLAKLLTHVVPAKDLVPGLALAFGRGREKSVKVAYQFDG